ncbi:Conserved_hypothetical protein [Hexamita inflata]|uniref:Uncharacterized protein n=1 Tax=Hexamita inflata TaxID=28002 RepID=A0AA86UX79_9EUKA|nr:Conserved hypothetical protein [Hexamita inflata]
MLSVQAQTEQNMKDVERFKKEQELKNRARQLRSEAAASLPCLRDACFPPHDSYEPYKRIDKLDDSFRRTNGAFIFERAKNYLALLAAHNLFPRGDIREQVIVRVINGQIVNIQLIGRYLSGLQQPIQQLRDLAALLFVTTAFPETDSSLDFYFPSDSNAVFDAENIQQVAHMVNIVDEISLSENPGKLFVNSTKVMPNEEILELKYEQMRSDRSELWIVLARFCNQHQAIGGIDLLPEWLNDYVKYQNPVPLPEEFTNQCNCTEQLQRLRMMLGMYPDEITMQELDNDKLPKEIQKILEQMPVWYQSKITQLAYIADSFQIGDICEDGVVIQCKPDIQDIKQLCQLYQ